MHVDAQQISNHAFWFFFSIFPLKICTASIMICTETVASAHLQLCCTQVQPLVDLTQRLPVSTQCHLIRQQEPGSTKPCLKTSRANYSSLQHVLLRLLRDPQQSSPFIAPASPVAAAMLKQRQLLPGPSAQALTPPHTPLEAPRPCHLQNCSAGSQI